MRIYKTLFVVAVAVVPFAFALPAQAAGDDESSESTYGGPTYTCDTVFAPGTAAFGEGNCIATNGAPMKGLITLGRSFTITARMAETQGETQGEQQTFRCVGGGDHAPGGNADTPTSVTGNTCS